MNYASIFIFEKILLYYFMEFKEIKGKKHYLYESLEEFSVFCPDISPIDTWRNALEGEWALTDDFFVCQVLKRTKLAHPGYKTPRTLIRTVCGSFIVEQKTHQILGDNGIAENIYTFSGNYEATYKRAKERKLNNREFLFARYVAAGENQIKAYKKAYPKAKDKDYIKNKSNSLLQKEEIRTMVKEEIKKILQEEGVTPEWIIAKYKDIADISDRDSDRLRSLESLAKISGLFDTEKKQEQLTVWTGFTDEQMEALQSGQKAKLVAHGEKEEE
tara:strand:- start:1774 stop:2592 length:819 start_codon:yes stop_codon:yes gene_type:complete